MSVMHYLSTEYIMDTSCPSKHWSTFHPRNDACFLNCRTENCWVSVALCQGCHLLQSNPQGVLKN